MASNVVSLDSDNSAATPVASKAQVIGRLATDVVVGKMNIELFWIVKGLDTITPSTLNVVSHRFLKQMVQKMGGVDRF
jgi:hypothetical protein